MGSSKARLARALAGLLVLPFLPTGLFASERGAREPVTLFLHQRGYVAGGSGSATTLTDAAVAAFARARPDVLVEIVGIPWTREGDLKLRAALLGGGRIDLFRVTNDQLPDFVPRRRHLLSPVENRLTEADRADIAPSALDAVRVRGAAMAWPLWSTAIVLIANEAILEDRGVTTPDGRPMSWEEFLDALARCAHERPDGSRVDGFTAPARPPLFEWSPLLWAHCAPLFSPADSVSDAGPDAGPDDAADDGGASADPFAPCAEAALARVAELRERGLVPAAFGIENQPEAWARFLEGRVAFLMTTPAFLRNAEGKGVRLRVLPPPSGDAGRAVTTGALGCFAVVAHDDDPARTDAAHDLARYLTSARVAEDVPGWYLAPPVRRSVPGFYDRPPYDALAPVVPTAMYIDPPGESGFLERSIVPDFQAVLLGSKSPRAALDSIRAALARASLD